MNTQAEGSFQMNGWDEKPIHELEGAPKLTRADVAFSYSGDLTGEGTTEYLLYYSAETTATFTGLERVVGSIGNRSGSFILQHTGTYEGTLAQWTATVVPGSATGELSGLRGHGSFAAKHGDENHTYTMEYELE